jgi:hypothetical protein
LRAVSRSLRGRKQKTKCRTIPCGRATVVRRPAPYPQLPSARPSDPAQLKSDARELQKLADAVPAQIDQVTKGQLSKELIENLKKIEKLSKRLRSEDSP